MNADPFAMVREHVRGIAAMYPAVTYHPDDPARTAIEDTAAAIGLVCVPNEKTRYRRIIGCPLPPPSAMAPQPMRWGTPGEFAEAVTALAAAFVNPGAHQRCPGCGGSGLVKADT